MAQPSRALSDAAFELLSPACRKRGVANATLLLAPAARFGQRYARTARVDRLIWPRGTTIDGAASGATMVVHADAATALALAHLTPQLIERANRLIGWNAVVSVRLKQVAPPRPKHRPAPPPPDPDEADVEAIAATLPAFTDEKVMGALSRMGARLAAEASKEPGDTA